MRRSASSRAGCARCGEHLALVKKLHYGRQKQRWFLEAVAGYCGAVSSFVAKLSVLELGSRGFVALRDYLAGYAESKRFTTLLAETQELEDELAAVRYAVQIKGNRVRVSRYEGEPDISEEVERTFAKFKQGAVKDYRVRFREQRRDEPRRGAGSSISSPGCIRRRSPSSTQYCARHERYLDETIGRFDREVQFYLAYLEYIEPLKSHGLTFSYPRVSARSKDVHADRDVRPRAGERSWSRRKQRWCATTFT